MQPHQNKLHFVVLQHGRTNLRKDGALLRELAQKPLISVLILQVREAPAKITIVPITSDDDG